MAEQYSGRSHGKLVIDDQRMRDTGFVECSDRAPRRIGQEQAFLELGGRTALLDDDGNFSITVGLPCFESLEAINDLIPVVGGRNPDRQGEKLFDNRILGAAVDQIGGFQLLDGKKAKAAPERSRRLPGSFPGLFFLHGITPDLPSFTAARFSEHRARGDVSSLPDLGTSMGSVFRRGHSVPGIAAETGLPETTGQYPRAKLVAMIEDAHARSVRATGAAAANSEPRDWERGARGAREPSFPQ